MKLKARTARWFEAYVPRAQTVYALESLANTANVELDRDLVAEPLADASALRDVLREAGGLRLRYADILPTPGTFGRALADSPETTARRALHDLRSWLACQLYLRRRLARQRAEEHRLIMLRRCLKAMGGQADELAALGDDQGFLAKRIYAYRADVAVPDLDDAGGHSEVFDDPGFSFHLVLSLPEHIDRYEATCVAGQCERIQVPDWLLDAWSRHDRLIRRRLVRLQAAIHAGRHELEERRAAPQVHTALSDLAILAWYLEHSVTLSADARHSRVTGWTFLEQPGELRALLARDGIAADIIFRPPPARHKVPVALDSGNPFRIFVTMFGIPRAGEVDPTALLRILVPLLFGLMFPDLGHGLILATGALLLSARHPGLRFLVPCGLSAAFFGVMFGEVFGAHGILPALLLRPLDHPLLILGASLVLGAVILLAGVALSSIEAYWSGTLHAWLWREGTLLLLYLGMLLSLADQRALWLSAAAVGLHLAGLLRYGWGNLAAGIGGLLHSSFDLALHTLSFARVGAFALAHVALSHALAQMAGLLEGGVAQAVVLVLGHALIILVEGLIVFVQTTRLVLFEFFSRFLRADGRLFHPLSAP